MILEHHIYHSCENNHDCIILIIFDEKSMQQLQVVFMIWVITYYYSTTCNVMM